MADLVTVQGVAGLVTVQGVADWVTVKGWLLCKAWLTWLLLTWLLTVQGVADLVTDCARRDLADLVTVQGMADMVTDYTTQWGSRGADQLEPRAPCCVASVVLPGLCCQGCVARFVLPGLCCQCWETDRGW